MNNIEIVEALLDAIEHDRFQEIESLHNPGASFHSFRGPAFPDPIAIGDWYREFLRDYADCRHEQRTFLSDGDLVAVRALIRAKGIDWRPFDQRVAEVIRIEDGGISERRVYAMPAGTTFEKPVADALKRAEQEKSAGAEASGEAVRAFFTAIAAGDVDAASELLAEDAVVADGVFGSASGSGEVARFLLELPRPAFGRWHRGASVVGAAEALVELAIAPGRPRLAVWVWVVEGRIALLENYWMLREIGVHPDPAARPRNPKQVILPI